MNYIIFSIVWMAISFGSFNRYLDAKDNQLRKGKRSAYAVTCALAFLMCVVNIGLLFGVF